MLVRRLAAAALCLAALSATAARAQEAGMAGECWHDAFVAGDADGVAACYAPDAIMWFPGGPMAQGRDAIRQGYAGYFDTMTIKSADLTQLGSTVSGDDAVAWGTFVIVMVSKESGQEVTEVGRYTDVQKRIDGRWVYVVDHASDDPPPPSAPDADADAPASSD